jgi:aminopeptidase-like protein
MSREELLPHLHSLSDRSSWIPYRTSYYEEAWGFCLTHDQLQGMGDGPFEVCIDSDLQDGHLTYGELVLPGEILDEILISTHVCHPSMANDNLSGIAVATYLAAELQAAPHRHTMRFLFAPGTIGSLTWLALHESDLRIRHGLALAGVGDAGDLTYKRTRRGTADVDRAVAVALRDSGAGHAIQEFSPWGYDERQFNSPGFDLPVGLLMRTPHGTYPEYHTSADDLDFVRQASLQGSLEACRAIVAILDGDRTYRNLSPKGEPALGRRGLYSPVGGSSAPPDRMAILWVLNLSDGRHSLLDIAERSGLSFGAVADAARALEHVGLLAELPFDETGGALNRDPARSPDR